MAGYAIKLRIYNELVERGDAFVSAEEYEQLDLSYLKPVIDKGKTVVFYDSYRKKNSEKYDEFERVNIKMRDIGIKKLEPLDQMDSQIQALQEKRESIYQEYSELKNESERIIANDERQEQAKEEKQKETER
ncbi:MAG: hypothetical protein ACK5LX_11530 [Oscillospiraceae bacterium]